MEAAQAVLRSGKQDDPAVMRQLAICEASDWFWWLSENKQSVDEAAFDTLFRRQISELYELIDVSPPESLDFSVGGQDAASVHGHGLSAGTMRRSS